MERRLRVLLVEDSEEDALLTLRALRRGGIEPAYRRVQTREDMAEALEREPWDAILCDYTMPRFSAPDAFAVLREKGLDLPFIIISGTVGEETAVRTMQLGVHDYLLKGQLTRLVPAIDRELRECEDRRARRRAEAELRESEERYRLLFECTPLPMWVFDTETLAFLAVNEAAALHYGHAREAFTRLGVLDVHPEEDASDLRERHARGEAPDSTGSWRHRKRDGSIIFVEIEARDLPFEGRPGRLVAVHDVTARKLAEEALGRTEEQLRQAQKMEAIGRLAGGVAHDFNNMLTVVLSYASLLLADMGPGDPMRPDLEEIAEAGRRAAELTRQLLAFSRKQVLQPKVVDLNQILAGMQKMLARLIGAGVEQTVHATHPVWKVLADPGQVEQVIMNLAVNARDAMPRGGRLAIETRNVDIDEDEAREHAGVSAGPHVMIAVSDTGAGMDRATQARIFEPFFTTKGRHEGTGLGLATVLGIVQQSGGHIRVSSEPGEGTTFRVYFPATDAASGPATTRPPARGSVGGNETILLVETDAQVRVVTRNVLHRAGYTVLEASTPGEALLISEQHAAKVDLLLTDVILPRMSGPELARRVSTWCPGVKVLFMSGNADKAIAQHGLNPSSFSFLGKPLTPESLTRKIREVLGREAEGDEGGR